MASRIIMVDVNCKSCGAQLCEVTLTVTGWPNEAHQATSDTGRTVLHCDQCGADTSIDIDLVVTKP
jgi:transcription elongation factor Elf1